MPAPDNAAPLLSYLALGDSYTIGEGVLRADSWPLQLAAMLRARRLPLADPQVIAKTGWTTDELDAAITAAKPPSDQDFVTLLIGVNNQYRGQPVADYALGFAALLSRAITFAGDRPQRVLVLSIPDWGVTRFGQQSGQDVAAIADAIEHYNATARAICQRRGVAFVDITMLSRQHGDALAADGLHPSAALHARWAEAALPTAQRLLRS
jgi:lysophospholipase L1-like esterase